MCVRVRGYGYATDLADEAALDVDVFSRRLVNVPLEANDDVIRIDEVDSLWTC